MQIHLSILTFTHGVLKIERGLKTPTVAVDRPPWGFLFYIVHVPVNPAQLLPSAAPHRAQALRASDRNSAG